jgi:hypothetical protein
MKSFEEYLTESKKTYEFKIKVAGDLKEGFADELKAAMEKFSVSSISKGKRTPIQEVPLDFPALKNCQVTVFDLAVHYPTTPQVLESYIGQVCSCKPGHLVVVTSNAPSEEYQESMNDKPDQVLGEEEENIPGGQEMVGEKRISSFLKDLAADSKTRASAGHKEKASPMPEPGASISPIGSKAQQGK